MYNGKLPPAWARLNPATEKPLGPWMAWFSKRQEQYKVRPLTVSVGYQYVMPGLHYYKSTGLSKWADCVSLKAWDM